MSTRHDKPDFDKAPKRVKARLRPAIIEAVDNYENDVFKVSHLDSRYKGQRIGSNMEVLVDTGLAKILEEDRQGVYDYKVIDSLDPAMEKAEEAFRYRIISVLEGHGEDAVFIADDLEDKGLIEAYGSEALMQPRNDDYSQETLEFLSYLGMIESVDDRSFISDQRDLDYIEWHSDEWRQISNSLLQNGSLPREHSREKQSFP